MKIQDILKPEELHDLSQFSAKDQNWLNKRIKVRKDGNPGVECIVRGMNTDDDYFELKPEEVVRQLYAHRLIEEYGYSKDQLEFEVSAVYAGREIVKDKRIDIAIYSGADKKKPVIIIEVKRPEVKDENAVYEGESSTPRQQMESYCLLKKARVGVIANGANLLKFYAAPDFENALVIDRFPRKGEDITDWIENRRFTLKQLMQSDRLQSETLKDIILAVEQRFGANDSSDKATEYKYIELANIGTSGEITGCTVNKGAELPTRARRMVHAGNIIISSIEGSLQSCALITEDYDGALCSTGFYVLDSDKINSETLLVLFKSEPMQALLKQQCSGTILTSFGKEGLLSIPIPDIDAGLQDTIKSSVAESFALRQHSLDLLEAAKRAVEIAIEQNEQTATAYLDSVM